MENRSNQFRSEAWQILWDCRGLLAFLGILIHSARIYSPETFSLSDGDSHIFFKYIVDFIHAFRMEAFFVLSGCAAHIVYRRESTNFFANRVVRLLVPFVVVVFLLNLPVFRLIDVALNRPFEGNLPVDVLSVQYWMGGHWIAHLWFLRELLVFTAIYVVLINSKSALRLVKFGIRQFLNLNHASRKIAIAFGLTSVALMPAVAGYLFPISYSNLLGGDNEALGTLRGYAFYGIYFATGAVVAGVPAFAFKITQMNRTALLFCIAVCLLRGGWAIADMNDAAATEFFRSAIFAKMLMEVFRQATVVCLMYLTVQWVRFLRGTQFASVLKTWSKASYTVYLAHCPVVWFFAIALKPMDEPIIWKFCFIVFSSALLSLAFHAFFVAGKVQLTRFLFTGQLARA
jgi:glucans biosynthesis protein C